MGKQKQAPAKQGGGKCEAQASQGEHRAGREVAGL